MTDIVLATGNPDKIGEISRILEGVSFLSLADFPGITPAEETGSTLEENAVIKARAAAGMTGKTAMADDSGLEVDALGGLPGVKSARFAGAGVSYEENNRKLLALMDGKSNRKAKFRCVIAIAEPGGKTVTREGVCAGEIAEAPRGEYGFGYDPVFIVEGTGKTFAEMPPGVKNAISHRARALEEIKLYLKKALKGL